MSRFLPAQVVAETVDSADFWSYLTALIGRECQRAAEFLQRDELQGKSLQNV